MRMRGIYRETVYCVDDINFISFKIVDTRFQKISLFSQESFLEMLTFLCLRKKLRLPLARPICLQIYAF